MGISRANDPVDIEKIAVKNRRGAKQSPVHAAVARHHLRELVVAINDGEDIEAWDDDGRTPLFLAAFNGHKAVLAELLRNGAQVNARDADEKTPLHYAAQEYQLDVIELLVRGGALVDAQDKDGNTPLSEAVYYSRGRGAMITLLLKMGAKRTLKNRHGVSPVELANTISNYRVDGFFK